MYGPIPVIDKNLPISAGVDEVKVFRLPVDDCFEYIVNLVDEALPCLPDKITATVTEAGRIDKSIALSVKAYILTTAASPLFNGNPNYSGFVNEDNHPYFNMVSDQSKWQNAVYACKRAVEFCDSVGFQLYEFQPGLSQTLSQTTINQLSVRNAVTVKWNSEIIWGNPNNRMVDQQRYFMPRGLDPANAGGTEGLGVIVPTLKMAQMFYTKNGIPLKEDDSWDNANMFGLRVATEADRINLINGYSTAQLNFDREDRFYASLGFDGGVWYGQGKYDDLNTWNV
jgi:hypothetical protein